MQCLHSPRTQAHIHTWYFQVGAVFLARAKDPPEGDTHIPPSAPNHTTPHTTLSMSRLVRDPPPSPHASPLGWPTLPAPAVGSRWTGWAWWTRGRGVRSREGRRATREGRRATWSPLGRRHPWGRACSRSRQHRQRHKQETRQKQHHRQQQRRARRWCSRGSTWKRAWRRRAWRRRGVGAMWGNAGRGEQESNPQHTSVL
jgi:hypothetical protein